MKMTKVRLIGLSTIDLPIIGATPIDPYILKSFEGLGPPEVDVAISETLYAGGVYQGRRPQGREAVFTIGLNPDYRTGQTAADLRVAMYGLLTPGSSDQIEIHILDKDNVQATTIGYTKRLEPSPFSKDPEVQIVISCLHPYLQAPTPYFVSPGSVSAPVIENRGTAPTGFRMTVVFVEDMSSWSLIDSRGRRMQFNHEFKRSERLVIDTRHGSRSISLIQDSVAAPINLMHSLSSDSQWHQLHGGANHFTVSSSSFVWGDVYYTPQYWGI